MRRPAALAAGLLAAVLLVGCTGTPAPGRAQIDVDTPELREMKADAGVEPCVPGEADPVEGGLPEVTVPCFGGGPDVDLSRLRGPLVVNFWASWCTPCREEMPILQSFYEEHGKRVDLLGVNESDTQPEAAMQLVADTGVTYPLVADPQAELSGADPIPRLAALPLMAFVDEDGEVVHREFVVIESQEQLEDLVREHLGVRL